jgi:hypothetical protein
MWRSHGPGDEVRRAVWFLDTQRHGLQPYGEDAQAVLEDAYLFLKWSCRKKPIDGNVLLTVQVLSPDGSISLVQFSSLTSATAIGKGLGGAIALFKRRVYRGACRPKAQVDGGDVAQNAEKEDHPEKCIQKESELVEDHDLLLEEDQELLLKVNSTDANVVNTCKTNPDDSDLEWRLGLHAKENQNPFDRSELPPSMEGPSDKEPTPDSEEDDSVDGFHDVATMLAYPFDEKDDTAETTDICNADNVDHLVLVVHGIGEMLQAIDLFGISKLSTIIDCCRYLRENHGKVIRKMYRALLDGSSRPLSGRVEYVPVEWHEAFTIHSQRRHSPTSSALVRRHNSARSNIMIGDVSLRTIPQIRQVSGRLGVRIACQIPGWWEEGQSGG